MMDDKDIRQVEERTWRSMRLSRRFFENWLETLEDQAELNRRTLEGLRELVKAHDEAFGELSQESLDAYGSFVESLSSYQQELEEQATSQGSREHYLMLLERSGELRRGSGRLPDDFWDLPRPEDPEGLVRSAVQEDRR